MENDSHALPHGAIGIDTDQFAVVFRDDKIVFILKDGSGRHFTLSAGYASGVIDLHETNERDNVRRTLFAIEREALPKLLAESGAMMAGFLRLFRPLRLGWLGHHGIGIARGVDPVAEGDIAAVTRKRRKRLVVEPKLWEKNIFIPEYLDEILDFPDGNFALLKDGERIGIGFKRTETEGQVRLYWIKVRDLERFFRRWGERVQTALLQAALPRDRYADFQFLRE